MITMITNADLSSFECRNNFSARSQPAIVKDLIDKECEKGFLKPLLSFDSVNVWIN
jgi:hypothetical protein